MVGIQRVAVVCNFNPRSPHGERRRFSWRRRAERIFQPTLPARGATSAADAAKTEADNFNPRSPHGERQRVRIPHAFFPAISTHAPRTGSDSTRDGTMRVSKYISTHAPRTGSDERPQPADAHGSHFNPRSPHGERRITRLTMTFWQRSFQPTLPARGATFFCSLFREVQGFQPTLPARGATQAQGQTHTRRLVFQPTLPARGATKTLCRPHRTFVFQPTLPARGATPSGGSSTAGAVDFNPRSPHGERLHGRFFRIPFADFNPRSPHGERLYQ